VPVSQPPESGSDDLPIAYRRPLFAAGFTTAFGAHSIAANLGVYTHGRGGSLFVLGVLLALYDGAEVVLKPVFGTLVDRIGAKPVLVGGLLAFAAASAAFVIANDPAALTAVRLGQGAAASAFSPAASTMVARLTPGKAGRSFGSYGGWKGLGYMAGPLLGSALVALGGFDLLFAVLAALGVGVAVWAAVALPSVAPLPKRRATVADLARRLSTRDFLAPTAALAGATAALSAGVGFLPVVARDLGLGVVVSGATVSLLAASAALAQPRVGRALDSGRLAMRTGLCGGLLACATGLALVVIVEDLAGLLIGAIVIGLGTALITPLGFAHLAAGSAPERMGATMGSAEVGRELGDAGGPLIVGALATVIALSGGLAGLAILLAVGAAGVGAAVSRDPPPSEAGHRH
jgi:DHA1 family tetracycline resistance protein-like MFS transporter